jgi:hypothetical protein
MLVLASALLLIALLSTPACADCGPGSSPDCMCVIFSSELEELFRRLEIGHVTLPAIDPPAEAGAFELLLAEEYYSPAAAEPLLINTAHALPPIPNVTRPLPQPYVEPDPALFAPYSAALIPEPNTFLLALLATSLFAARHPVRQR